MWVGILGIGLFELLQLGHEAVKFPVVDGRSVEHIVVVVMLVQLFSQLPYAKFCLIHGRLFRLTKIPQKCKKRKLVTREYRTRL